MRPRSRRPSPESVYDALAPAVLGYFRSHRMRDPEALTGDVFVSVVRRFDSFEGDADALRRWVFTIAHNVRVDEIRRAQRRPEGSELDTQEGATTDPDPFDPALTAALGRLTADQRDVLVLRFVADLPIDTVADLLDRSAGSVKMLQARALAALAHDPEVGREDS